MTLRLPRALGAVAGQVTLALGSFVLQLVAVRALGASGFGVFAMLFGAIVMATAVSTGLVGDTLTVLDRHDPVLRSALARTAGVVLAATVATAVLGGRVLGLTVLEALAFGLATGAFMAADLARRLLMAVLRFWRLVLVDGLALVATMAVVAVGAATGTVGLATILLALAAGQGTATLVAVLGLPAAERTPPRRRHGGVRSVVAFGGWRSVQQFVRPTTLNATRWLVLASAGAAAVGTLEAARLFVAPAMLLVQGIGSYLFASYAADRAAPPGRLLRRADRAAFVMLAGATGATAAAAVAVPVLGSLVAPDYRLSTVAVVGWGVYAASCAAVLPYGSLAAVRGRQAAVLGLRVADSALSLAVVGLALLVLDVPAAVTPWLLAAGSFAGGALCRRVLLVPLVTSPSRPAVEPVATGAAA
jgi:O-antigen/teichoic acid export membrane protein